MTTYEAALARIEELEPAESDNERSVDWIDDVGNVGVARTGSGRVELFFVGPELEITYQSIADQMTHQQYFRKGGPAFTASRLELPLAGHFDQVAAFICAELSRNGSDADVASAFVASEPVIDLALERLHNSDSWLRGLVAEVALLNAMVLAAPIPHLADVMGSWAGYQPSLRDFGLNGIGVEVKATMRTASTHSINGLHQVEPQDGEDGLFLASFVGVSWQPEGSDADATFTARKLVEGIVARLDETDQSPDLADRLWFQVSEYLPKSTAGPDPLDRPFRWIAVRTYDLSDPVIQILRADDVAKRPNTVLDSVRFDIELPDQVSGDVNPIVGLNKSASMLLNRAGWL